MEAVQALPPIARKMTVDSIMKNVGKLLELRRLAQEGKESLLKYRTRPANLVMNELREKHERK